MARSVVREVLRAAVFGEPEQIHQVRSLLERDATAADGLAELAALHGVPTYVARLVDAAGLSVPLREQNTLKQLGNMTAMNHLQVVGDLHYLSNAMGGAGIDWLTLKGPVLAEHAHGDPVLRSYSDVDLLVPPNQLAKALDVLEAAGATVLDRNWELLAASMKGELHVRLPSGTLLDLHWHLLNSARLRRHFSIDIDELFARARTMPIGPVTVRTLSASDSVVYVALHAMLSGAHRLMWVKDVERLLVVEDVQSHELLASARPWGAELALRAAIERVDQATSGAGSRAASLPSASVGQAAWLSLSRRIWRSQPVEAENGSGSAARLVARAVRPSPAASFVQFVRRGGNFLRHRGDDTLPLERTSSDSNDPQSVLYESGNEDTKQRYLHAVANWPQ